MPDQTIPLSEEAAKDEAARLIRAAYQPTAVRIEDPEIPSWQDGPQIGTAPAVPQPGIPPMSARTIEITRAVMYASMATVPPGLIAVAVMVASQHANPTVIGMICAAPAAIAVPILALARLIRRAGEAAPTEIHQTYTGPVRQETHVDQRRSITQKDIHKH